MRAAFLAFALTGIQFVDIAPKSAFSYRTENDLRERKYFPQPMCGGVALIDFDHDGKLDIFFTNGARLPENAKADPKFYSCLLRNKGAGVFEDVTSRAGLTGKDAGYQFGVAAADFDNDGNTDLFVAAMGGNRLYRNQGDGTFADITRRSGLENTPADLLSVGGAWVDYDRDGVLDLVVANYTHWTPATDKRCVSGETEFYCDPRGYRSVPQSLYRGLGDGRFADVSEASGIGTAKGKGMGIGIADLNRDGWSDVFVANDTERNFLFLNQKNGSFKEVGLLVGAALNDDGVAVSSMGVDVKDFDNDGWPDIFYNDLAGQFFGLLRNEEGETFRYVSPATHIERLSRAFSGWSAAFADFDNDGWKDIYSANGHVDNLGRNTVQQDTIFQNVNGQTFRDISGELGTDIAVAGYQRGAAVGDLNDDGWLDLVVTSLGQRPRILMNSGRAGTNWAMLRLRGVQSNRDGIGAAVKLVTASGRALYSHVSPSAGFLSSSDIRVHFGLGAENRLREVEVLWPSGKRQLLSAVAANRITSVTEP